MAQPKETFLKMIESLDLPPKEKNFLVDISITQDSSLRVQARVISEFYFVKRLGESVNKVIVSNRRNVKGMLWLTGALVFVGLANIAVTLITYLV